MSIRKIIAIIIVIVMIGFGYYAISPLFNNIQANDAVPGTTADSTQVPAPDAQATANASDTAPMPPMDEAMPSAGSAQAAPSMSAPVDVMGTIGHPASGTALVVVAGGMTYVRYENLQTINGPDLHVYLSKSMSVDDSSVDLGSIKATEGNVNYEVPAGVSVADYTYVLIWCKPFGVLFNSAKIGS